MIEFEEFQLITGVWCNKFFHENDLTNSLRTKENAPRIDICDYNISDGLKKLEIATMQQYKKNIIRNMHYAVQPIGDVLRFYPDRNIGDGALHNCTDGFFSEDDIPPWDIWFYFEKNIREDENIIYCWIPDKLKPLVCTAIEADNYQCLKWN